MSCKGVRQILRTQRHLEVVTLAPLPRHESQAISLPFIPSSMISNSVTYAKPVGKKPPDDVFKYPDSDGLLGDVCAYPRHIKTLTLGPMSLESFSSVQYMLKGQLRDQMASLKELNIFVDYDCDISVPRADTSLDLSFDAFPNLRISRLRGVHTNWESPIFSSVTTFELRNCPVSHTGSIATFTRAILGWASLTNLSLHHAFLQAGDAPALPDLSESGIYQHTNLIKLIIEGPISLISAILYRLDAPHADVHIIGHAPGPHPGDARHSIFDAMLPFVDYLPSHLAHAVAARAVVTPKPAEISGTTADGTTVALEVRGLDLSTPAACAHLFAHAVSALSTAFGARRAPLGRLDLHGDGSLARAEWDLFLHSPSGASLEAITFRDSSACCEGARHLFDALGRAHGANADESVCPALRRIGVSTEARASPRLVEHMGAVLDACRALGRALENLDVEFADAVEGVEEWVERLRVDVPGGIVA
ncbi:uncharacterized protein BXZ73DRAFT_79285 [Epithele typhae]|uniref:uncharacterized protein n=1 Tax=Epithele typhae TaxID=378194 RepID=UPI0020085D5D|nr:uncharacterized protein BXZ73DRAFT_79285 [Epithele typhae]KAH9924320.1 hypothetical protein BXZ73DRAFT_79285 [Epithele typhae]